MPKFTILWQMRSDQRSLDEKTGCGFWMHELNANWTVKCVCELSKLRNLDFMEVHRKCRAGEMMISGTLEIYDEKRQCIQKKKFISLLEEGCLFTRIDFQHCRNATKPSKTFLVTGQMTISARTEDSFELNELVSLTNTDYSSLRLLSNDMETLLLKKSFSTDVSLKCGVVSIPAHKSILSARSPVLNAMFSCPMKEAMENEIVIKDIEAPVLQDMVKYIYTGKTVDVTPSRATNLLFAANKYQIGSLESSCSKYLMLNMSMKDAVIVLRIGDLISPELKNFAIDFVCNKCSDYSTLEKSKDWVDLKNNNPALALEVFSTVIKFQEQKLKMRK